MNLSGHIERATSPQDVPQRSVEILPHQTAMEKLSETVTTRSTAIEFEVIGGHAPADELLELLAGLLLDLLEADGDAEGGDDE